MRLFLLILAALPALCQQTQLIEIIPNRDTTGMGTTVGEIRFRDKQTIFHYVGIQAPPSVIANFSFVLPDAPAVGCLVSNITGVLSIDASCTGSTGSGFWNIDADNNLFPTSTAYTINKIKFQDQGAVNPTSVVIKLASNQGTSPALSIQDASGTQVSSISYLGNFTAPIFAAVSGSAVCALTAASLSGGLPGLLCANSTNHIWSSTSSWLGTPDLGISRDAAGVLQINNGTVGTYRDMKARNIELTNRLGIGVTPTESLDVNGNFRINGAIYPNTTNAYDVGTVSLYFANSFQRFSYAEQVKIASPGSSFGTSWTLTSSGYVLTFTNNVPATFLTLNANNILSHSAKTGTIDGDWWPTSDLAYDLGGSTLTASAPHGWRKGFIGEVNTDTINSLSTILKLNGATSTNGNILIQPGNVAGNASAYIISPRVDQPGLIVQDANGTTTSDGLELRTFGGSIYFKVIGGTDSGAPGTVVTKDVVPFTNNTQKLGNSSHLYSELWVQDIHCSGVCPGVAPFIDTTPIVYASGDPTKQVAIKANLLTSGAHRNWSFQDFDATFAAIDHTETFTAAQTFAANILTTSGINIGTAANPFADNYLKNVFTESIKLASPGTSYGTSWTLATSSTTMTITDNSPAAFLVFNVNVTGAHTSKAGFITGDWWPSADQTYDLGSSITTGGGSRGWRQAFIGTVNTNTINSLSSVLTVNGAASSNGNILLQPGNVAGSASVFVQSPRLDWPGLIVRDPSGTTTGNSFELRTNSGTIYFKVIAGTDSGAPGQVGARGFFCIVSGSCDLGFSTNRFSTGYFSSINASSVITANGGITFGAGTSSTIITGSSGNFYTRPIAGSGISCSGVPDGWLAGDSSGINILMCFGGNRYKVALAAY